VDENCVVSVVMKKFPDLAPEIKKLFGTSESFREICEDYVLCLNSIRKIESADPRKDENLKEFKETLKELEEELMAILKSVLSTKK